ncbi:CPBP family intramembrane metalloprotease domain-containing protein [Sphingobacteriaceae bacterium]|nr:CPBP family intramembrane metalloprotease domain-containing protein [Sphingobacteriaceae bacterium]
MMQKNLAQNILHFPLTKIIIGIVAVVATVGLGQYLAGQLLDYLGTEKPTKHLIVGLITAVLSFLSYTLLFKNYEKRDVTEFNTKKIGQHLLVGILLGALLQSLTISVIYLKGGFTVLSVNPLLFLIPSLTMAFTSAIFEEVLVRGIIFRILEEKLGSYISLILSALIFGALHLGNPHSTIAAAVGLALQAGLFLAAAFMFSRNLWFPIAIHFAWNFSQSGIFGATVSGNSTTKSLLTTTIKGEDWYTGGAFGPEGSVQATVFCLLATFVLLMLCNKQNKIIKPYWTRSKEHYKVQENVL